MIRRFACLLLAASAFVAPAVAGQFSQTLQGRTLRLDDLVANVDVKLDPSAQGITVTAEGLDEMIALLSSRQDGDQAIVAMGNYRKDNLDISDTGLRVTVTMAPGTALSIDDFVGTMLGGDLNAPLTVDATAGTLAFGRVKDVTFDNDGAADLTVGDVDGRVTVKTSGAGDFEAGNARDTSISISGAGDIDLASVSGALDVKISGAGDVDVGRVNGAVSIAVTGVGDVKVRAGTANPLQISNSGVGRVDFNGTGVNPTISSSGMGDICVARVEGEISLDGSSVTIDPDACGRS